MNRNKFKIFKKWTNINRRKAPMNKADEFNGMKNIFFLLGNYVINAIKITRVY